MEFDDLKNYIETLDNIELTFPYDKSTYVYKIKDDSSDGKMFAIIAQNKKPIQLSVRCDQQLSKKLQELYESVMPANNLNKKRWITVLFTGQLDSDEIKSLVRLSYDLALKS